MLLNRTSSRESDRMTNVQPFIAATIIQACAGVHERTQCQKPWFTPAGVAGPCHPYPPPHPPPHCQIGMWVWIKTNTYGANLRYTLDCSIPSESHGKLIPASSGWARVKFGLQGYDVKSDCVHAGPEFAEFTDEIRKLPLPLTLIAARIYLCKSRHGSARRAADL